MTEGHDIIAIVGASNGLGCGRGPYEYTDGAIPETIYEVFEPVPGEIRSGERAHDPITLSYGSKRGHTGLIVSFCRRYVQTILAPNRRVAFVNPCIGGSMLGQWQDPPNPNTKGGADCSDLYIRLMRRLHWSLANLPGHANRVAALIVQIGENDINWIESDKLPRDYLLHAIPELVARFRAEFGDMPVTIGEPQQDWQRDVEGRADLTATIYAAQRSVPNSAFVRSDGLARNPLPQLKHFTAHAAVEMGVRHCDALRLLAETPEEQTVIAATG